MLKSVFTITALLLAGAAFAQLKEGKVLYERTMQMGIRPQGVNMPEPAPNVPRTRTDRYELSFTAGKVLWEVLPDAEEPEAGMGGPGGGPMIFRFGGDDLVYTNLETGVSVSKQELASKNYLVTDTVQKLQWKLTEETKEILGYQVRKATAVRTSTRNIVAMDNSVMNRRVLPDTTTITAWFATSIPVAAGPELNGQLPGLILELEMNRGRVVYRALEVSNKVNTGNIKEPKGGKAISAAEFRQERTKMMDEMRRNGPPVRRVQINQ